MPEHPRAYNLPIAAAEAAEAAEAARCAEAAGLGGEAAGLGGEVAEVVEAVESAATGAGGAAFGSGAFIDIGTVAGLRCVWGSAIVAKAKLTVVK